MRITTHMCRGNFRSSWFASGDYEYVAEVLLNELQVDGFFMEWDDERSGGFEPLRFLPPGKFVVLGLVTTKSGELEQQGRAQAPDRRGGEVRRHRPAVPLGAVRLLLDRRRQRSQPGAAGGEAEPDRRDRARGLGLSDSRSATSAAASSTCAAASARSAASAGVVSAATSSSWRSSPARSMEPSTRRPPRRSRRAQFER